LRPDPVDNFLNFRPNLTIQAHIPEHFPLSTRIKLQK
jgi:hypothetical protein